MTGSEHIITADENTFPYEVLAYSSQTPVIVDFWAEWCQPCKHLSPMLEQLTVDAEGAFRLAKIDVDENPRLVMDYDIRGIPAVKAFRNGQMVAEFSGLRPEAELREFLRQIAPSVSDLALEKGKALLARGQWSAARDAFRLVIKRDPDHASGLLGLAKSYLAQGDAEATLPILHEFPVSKEYAMAEQLLPLANALVSLDLQAGVEEKNDDWHPVYIRALGLISQGKLEAALDGLLDVLRANRNYLDGEARKVLVAALQLLGEDHPQSRSYRAELSSLLF
jgi:putative thioredoxin